MNMTALLLANIDLEELFAQLMAELKKRKPNLDLRIWPECGKPEEIEIVLAWCPPLGVMQRFPNLKLIISLGTGVEGILVDPDLPDGIPIECIRFGSNCLGLFGRISSRTLAKGRSFLVSSAHYSNCFIKPI
nr:hypothetical protein [Okeania sp. SIO2F4]